MRRSTVLVLAGTALGLIGYDIWAFVEPTDGDTISEVTLGAARNWLGIPFAFGALAGHFFVPVQKARPAKVKWGGFAALVATTGAMFAAHEQAHAMLGGSMLAALAAGVVAGAALWPQAKE